MRIASLSASYGLVSLPSCRSAVPGANRGETPLLQ
jgi:hypothetical protein